MPGGSDAPAPQIPPTASGQGFTLQPSPRPQEGLARYQIARALPDTYRGAYGIISYIKPGEPIPPGYQKVEYDENGDETPPYVKEKAPDLAAEGFSSSFKEKEAFSG